MLRLAFHLGVLTFNLYSIWFDQKYVDIPFPDNIKAADLVFKARIIFLTHWCFIFQTIYFTISTLNDLGGTNKTWPKAAPLIRKLKDVMFVVALPLAAYVSATFWTIYAIDRELIFPAKLDPFFPSWLNHSLHTYILGFILIELLTTFRTYPCKYLGSILTGGFMIIYIVWVNMIYFKYGVWVYPVLEVMNWFGRIVFYGFSTSVIVGFYIVGEKINAMIWKKELAVGKKKN